MPMALLAAQTAREPRPLTPDEVLEGYERASTASLGHDPLDQSCWRIVQMTLANLGPDTAGPALLRAARYRLLNGSLHGFRVGNLSANAHKQDPAAKGQIRAERELHAYLEAACEKWDAAVSGVVGASQTCQ